MEIWILMGLAFFVIFVSEKLLKSESGSAGSVVMPLVEVSRLHDKIRGKEEKWLFLTFN